MSQPQNALEPSGDTPAAFPPPTPPDTDTADRIRQIYARDYAKLCAAANAVLQDAHLAQDAVQEAWLRLSAPRTLAGLYSGDAAKLRGLILITVRHTALNMRRGARFTNEQPAPEETLAATPSPAPGPAEQAERNDAVQTLKLALNQLDETDRSILLLQYDSGCTGKQIAALLNLSEATVRKRAQRAKEKLRTLLAENREGGQSR